MNKLELQNKIMGAVRIGLKQIFESTCENFNDIVIKSFYPKENDEDDRFVNDNKKLIWDFMNARYIAAGVGKFLSCFNEKSLRKNANLIRCAYIDDAIVAISVYTGMNGGYRCVGVTATTDNAYREIGKAAAKKIIEIDMSNYNAYYWIICDEHIKRICERRNGILIPNDYSYLLDPRLTPAEDDDYKCYMKLLDGEQYEKYIFGFNSKETYDIIMQMNDERILAMIEKATHHIFESAVSLDEYDKANSIVNILYDERCEVSGCFSGKILGILKDSKTKLEEYFLKNINDDRADKFKLSIENAQDIIDSSSLLDIHEF